MNFAKGIAGFLSWLTGARANTNNPPTLPARPMHSVFAGLAKSKTPKPAPTPGLSQSMAPTDDDGEMVIIDVIDDRAAEEFLYFNVGVATPQSSNVALIWYQAENFKLFVEFKNTYVYEYFDITVELAYDFFVAVSKGRWVWDNLRTVRRAYQFVYSLNGKTPVRMEDPAATSVKSALGSLSILGVDPFSHTKSAKRVKIKYAQLNAMQAKTLKFTYQKQRSYQFLHPKRKRAGLQFIQKSIRGRP